MNFLFIIHLRVSTPVVLVLCPNKAGGTTTANDDVPNAPNVRDHDASRDVPNARDRDASHDVLSILDDDDHRCICHAPMCQDSHSVILSKGLRDNGHRDTAFPDMDMLCRVAGRGLGTVLSLQFPFVHLT